VAFIDWDFAAPCEPDWDLAFVAFSWVPLHARDVVAAEGFADFASRPRRLRLLLDAYGYRDSSAHIIQAVDARLEVHANDIGRLARSGDSLFERLCDEGVLAGLDRAGAELRQDARSFA
jgi:aminoglycoside phosphotransferase (APT) family kinase protein